MGLYFKYGIIKDKKEEIFFSKKYQVLSKHTTLFAQLENNETINNKMETLKNEKAFAKNNSDFKCFCGKSYLSKEALSNNFKCKHPFPDIEKRGRGRARKNPGFNKDLEINKYEKYFESNKKKSE